MLSSFCSCSGFRLTLVCSRAFKRPTFLSIQTFCRVFLVLGCLISDPNTPRPNFTYQLYHVAVSSPHDDVFAPKYDCYEPTKLSLWKYTAAMLNHTPSSPTPETRRRCYSRIYNILNSQPGTGVHVLTLAKISPPLLTRVSGRKAFTRSEKQPSSSESTDSTSSGSTHVA